MKKLICLDCRHCKTLSQMWGNQIEESIGWCFKYGIMLTAENFKSDNLSTYWGCFNAKEKKA